MMDKLYLIKDINAKIALFTSTAYELCKLRESIYEASDNDELLKLTKELDVLLDNFSIPL